MTVTVIEAVRRYLENCPLLQDGKINVDFLPEDTGAYTIDVIPTSPVIKSYLDGSTQRQFDFVIATRSYYGEHIRQQIDNIGLFEQFEEWLALQRRMRNYPELGDGRRTQKLEVTTSGYVYAPKTETARYQIQCKLTYFQKGARKN